MTEEDFLQTVKVKENIQERFGKKEYVNNIGITIVDGKYAVKVFITEEKFKEELPEKSEGIKIITKVGSVPRRR